MVSRRARGPPKLPTKQLAILAICRFAEPVALTSVFPYLPEMIESLGVPKKEVAWWAGMTSAAFSLSQCLTAVIWGRISDRFGRKPTILAGLTCTMISTMLWGMSTSLPMAILARSLAGACNGNVGIIRTMVAEMVPEKELQPRAFSLMPLVWTLGSIFGPSFGGFFAKPAENLPALFGSSRFLIKFPFALPNIIASVLFLVGITTGILFLKETLETKKYQSDYGLTLGKKLTAGIKACVSVKKQPKSFHRTPTAFDETSPLLRPASVSAGSESSRYESYAPKNDKPPLPRPTLVEVFTKQSVINLIAYTFLALHAVAYDQLLPIFLHTPRQTPDSTNVNLPFKFAGGFGLGSSRIGTLFTAYGFVGCIIQFLIFPPTARKYGVLNCFKCCAVAFPIICIFTPYTALIQSSNLQQAAMFGIMIVKSFAVIFAFPCSIILLTNSAVSLRILGTLNGFAVSVSAVGRAIGPAIGGAAYTWGIERGYVITPYFMLALIAVIGAIPIWYLVEMPGFSKTDDGSEDDDDDEEEDLLSNVDEDVDGEILEGDEVIYEEDDNITPISGPSISGTMRSRKNSDGERSLGVPGIGSPLERRMSSPIGIRGGSVGPGGGRRLSNGLAASNNGVGFGGTSFT
ncbi:related to E.coli tetracycline resistance protein TCR1 [Rhynchosporium graminicola]|uniref:Related to E.coli tetracycline resistance protein TCR1 n=1 Tax=Rhynchosporium graminicola TaxID=2792576 RepID=A0A1E1L1Q5_9HELO|nr:related to E.coli tetracycline resistance protein TCR1 [Rhynchosporium commune]